MIQQAIHDVIEGQDLSFEAAKEVMNEIMSGETTPAQMAAFLTGPAHLWSRQAGFRWQSMETEAYPARAGPPMYWKT